METSSPIAIRPVLDFSSLAILVITILAFLIPVAILFPPFPPSKREVLLQTHSRVGIEPSKSGLRAPPATQPASSSTSSKGTIRSLWIYPIKSCRGIEVARATVRPQGLDFDRLFTFAQLRSPFPVSTNADESEKSQHQWEFITQRQFPLLATVKVDLFVPDAAKARRATGVGTAGKAEDAGVTEPFLVLSFPWRETGLWGAGAWLAAKMARGLRAQPEVEVLLPVEFPGKREIEERGYGYEDVKIWRDTVSALNLEAELPEELRLYLGVSNRLGLFRVDPEGLREIYRCAPRQGEVGYQPVVGFQDAYPLHIINLNSVKAFETKLEKDAAMKTLDVRRFRANIIIDGPEPYDEETWKAVRFTPRAGGLSESPTFHVSCRTVRCKLPNVDQDTGDRHPVEPDKALRAYREVDAGAPKMGCLGMQLCPLFDHTDSPEDMMARIEVGMGLDVLETGEHKYIKI